MTREELTEALRWTPEERATFVERFPRLHHWPDGRPRAYSGLVGRGWIPLLERVFEVAEPDVRAVIGQVKEKYGSLRIYLDHYGFNAELDQMLEDVELESETMCEACGRPARQSETSRRWIVTLCETHMPEGAQYLDDHPSPPNDP